MNLSRAIARNLAPHPLDAVVATLPALGFLASDDARKRAELMLLHRHHPELGSTVRAWPGLAACLEREGVLPRVKQWQQHYRREIHASLYRCLCEMHGRLRWCNAQIGAALAGAGL